MQESHKSALLSSPPHSPHTSSAFTSFMLKLEKTPPISKLKRGVAALLRPGKDMDVLHTRNTASERLCRIQTHDKPNTSLKRPRHPCPVILSHRSLFINSAVLGTCTFSLSKYEHSYINPESTTIGFCPF